MAAAARRTSTATGAPSQAHQPDPAHLVLPAAASVSAQGRETGPGQGELPDGHGGRSQQPGLDTSQPKPERARDRNERGKRGGRKVKAKLAKAFLSVHAPQLAGCDPMPAILVQRLCSAFTELCATVKVVAGGAQQQQQRRQGQAKARQTGGSQSRKQQQPTPPPQSVGEAAAVERGTAQPAGVGSMPSAHAPSSPQSPVCTLPAPALPSSAAPPAPERRAAAAGEGDGPSSSSDAMHGRMEIDLASTSGRELFCLSPAEVEELDALRLRKKQKCWLEEDEYKRFQRLENARWACAQAASALDGVRKQSDGSSSAKG